MFTLASEVESWPGTVTVVAENGIQMVKTIIDGSALLTGVFWSYLGGLGGNMLSSYGLQLRWTVSYTSTDTTGQPRTDNKVVLLGRNNSRYAFPVAAVERDKPTILSIRLARYMISSGIC